MKDYNILVSIIVPIYNSEKYLKECLRSIEVQTFPKEEMEVLLIDDGSTDGSRNIYGGMIDKHSHFKAFYQENKGVSAARNVGLRNANGKYIFFVDSDDMISPTTIEKVVAFFEANYDEVDIVTYDMTYLHSNGKKKKHYRDRLLPVTGVYDTRRRRYINLTLMCVAIKNKTFFFDESKKIHEDEQFVANYVMLTGKFGYVKEAEYIYRKHDDSVTALKMNPYYIFEQSMSMYESMCKSYLNKNGIVELYIQEMILNDLIWKLRSNILFPYHYEEDEFIKAINRIKLLCKRIDPELILKHPNVDKFQKYFFLELAETPVKCVYSDQGCSLLIDNKIIFHREKIEIVVQKFKIKNGKLEICGYLKSPVFAFSLKPKLYQIINDNFDMKEEILLYDSSWSYYKSKTKTNHFYGFNIEISLNGGINDLQYIIKMGEAYIKPSYYFYHYVAFNHEVKRYVVYQDEYKIAYEDGKYTFVKLSKRNIRKGRREITNRYYKNERKVWLVRSALNEIPFKKKIWLYYDCHGVKKDNGYYQFIHDFKIHDGVRRYFILNDEIEEYREQFTFEQQKYVVKFGSRKHKWLYLRAEKVITAYIEKNNYLPFSINFYSKKYRDLIEQDIIYLQHGVLHAHLPWKYSFDRQEIDKEVISTRFEEKNFKINYGFSDKHLIKAGMPRYDYIDAKSEPKKKILFAPSWRKYLIRQKNNGEWEPIDDFSKSHLYESWIDFLKDDKLHQLLENCDFTLDFKLHPIFACYAELFENKDRVNIIKENVDETDYAIFITDFSSFSFDFLYLKRPVIYFVPDYEQFKAGLNDYRELDIDIEGGFGAFTTQKDKLIGLLQEIILTNGEAYKRYNDRSKDLFYYYDSNQCDRIYEKMLE